MTQRHHAVFNSNRSVLPNWHVLECKKGTKISRKSYIFLSFESSPPSGPSSANTALLATSDYSLSLSFFSSYVAASFACTSVKAQYQRQNKDVFFFTDFCRMWAVLAPRFNLQCEKRIVEGGAVHWIADRASGLIVAQPRGRRKLMSADLNHLIFYCENKIPMFRETQRIFYMYGCRIQRSDRLKISQKLGDIPFTEINTVNVL